MARSVKLGTGDSALIIRENGAVEFVVPNHNDDEDIPEGELLVIGIAMAVRERDHRFLDLIWKVWEEVRAKADAKAH